LKYKRADKVVAVNDLALAGELAIYTHPFLGILPLRDDPKLGVEVRYVYPRSPADVAGIKAGDRIVKVSTNEKPPVPFQGAKRGRDELFDILNKLAPGTDIKLEVLREGGKKTDTVSVKLADMPGSTRAKDDTVPEKLPKVASAKKALEALEKGPPPDKGPKVKGPKVEPPKKDKKDDKVDPPKKEEKADPPKTGFIKRTNAAGHKYWIWVPTEYDPNISYSLVVWLHPPGKNKDEDGEKLADAWEDYCADNHIILVGPQTDAESGWIPSDSDFVLETMRDVMGRYTIDRQRVVAHGMGVGGQMAVYLGFSSRDLIRGVATTGAVVTQAKDNVATQRLAFYLAAGDRDPLAKAVADCRFKLIDHQLPVVYRELANRGREYLDERTLGELVRWIDALDRQ
ncbi:MAG TPA: PDZ domain-containing protein, partial [Gemmataceae bacterium]|nr:PDZ domain-containing protein [Gemmataceae bacterium]